MAKSKDTGLGGRSNFFKGTGGEGAQGTPEPARLATPEATAGQPSPAPATAASAAPQDTTNKRAERSAFMTKSGRVRTTVTLWPETLDTLEKIKGLNRRSGRKETLGDVIEAAIQALIKERNLHI